MDDNYVSSFDALMGFSSYIERTLTENITDEVLLQLKREWYQIESSEKSTYCFQAIICPVGLSRASFAQKLWERATELNSNCSETDQYFHQVLQTYVICNKIRKDKLKLEWNL